MKNNQFYIQTCIACYQNDVYFRKFWGNEPSEEFQSDLESSFKLVRTHPMLMAYV